MTGKIGQCGAELILGEKQPNMGVFEQELESFRWQFRVDGQIGATGFEHAEDADDQFQ